MIDLTKTKSNYDALKKGQEAIFIQMRKAGYNPLMGSFGDRGRVSEKQRVSQKVTMKP